MSESITDLLREEAVIIEAEGATGESVDLLIDAADEITTLRQQLAKSEARAAEYDALVDEMDKATRLTYLSGPVVVEQFKRLRQKADEAERAGGENA